MKTQIHSLLSDFNWIHLEFIAHFSIRRKQVGCFGFAFTAFATSIKSLDEQPMSLMYLLALIGKPKRSSDLMRASEKKSLKMNEIKVSNVFRSIKTSMKEEVLTVANANYNLD